MDDKTAVVEQIVHDYDSSLQIKITSRPLYGYSNSVYFVTFHDGSSADLVLKFTESGDNAEVLFYKLLKQSTAGYFPVPQMLKYDSTPLNYHISSKLPGLPLSEVLDTMTRERRLEIYRNLGAAVGQFHSKHTYEEVGYLNGQRFDRWKYMFSEIVEHQAMQFKGTMFEELATTVHKYLISNLHLIDNNIVPRLLHMDLHRGNILVLDTKITGILDAADALIGHNEYELMRIEKGHFEDESNGDDYRKAFMSSYANHMELDDGYAERRRIYSLSRELVGMKCLVDYGEKYAPNGSVEQARKDTEDKIRRMITTS